jgi:DNA-binding transcriptional MerR regulator
MHEVNEDFFFLQKPSLPLRLSHMPTMTEKQFNIKETAKLTGISAPALRIWELRYGWPKPDRKANGYRLYKETLIQDLQWVVTMIAAGKTMRELIDDDGKLISGKKPEKKKSLTKFDFSSIALPVTAEGLRIRHELEHAIGSGDEGKIALLQSMAARLRPDERERAITAVLRSANGER